MHKTSTNWNHGKHLWDILPVGPNDDHKHILEINLSVKSWNGFIYHIYGRMDGKPLPDVYSHGVYNVFLLVSSLFNCTNEFAFQ